MAEGRFDNPIAAALTGFYDLFRKQELAHRFTGSDTFDGKTVLITGANSGLGFALAVDAARRNARVIMGCRRQIPEAGEMVRQQSGSNQIEMRYIDLSKIDTIQAFVDRLAEEGRSVDIVYLNAASAAPRSRQTPSGLDELFLVNYFSNFILINLLLARGIVVPDETRQPRIIFISSDSHRGSSAIDYGEFGRYFEYGLAKAMSNYSYFKLVLNTFATELSRRINKETLKAQVNVICPGPVNSNIIRETPLPVRLLLRTIFSVIFRSPERAARPVTYMGTSDDFLGKTNEYLHMFIPKRMDEKVYDPAEGMKLWRTSEELWKKLDKRAALIY